MLVGKSERKKKNPESVFVWEREREREITYTYISLGDNYNQKAVIHVGKTWIKSTSISLAENVCTCVGEAK